MVIRMRKVLLSIMLMTLMVINIASFAHASCGEQSIDAASKEVIASADHSHSQGHGSKQADVDCCLNGHHHHVHSLAYISLTGTAHSLDVSALNQYFEQQTYRSLTHFPPSKPPKA